MIDESLYSTSNEAALAVVATSMKKARLPIEILIVNSFMGGIFFTTGGMLYVVIESYCMELKDKDPGILYIIQGLIFPVGLFYVVITGTDLFNSNILFFSVGLVRGAVSILDLLISWLVSYFGNLVANIFVCYIFCNYSHISRKDEFVQGSRDIIMEKASFSFVDNLIKGMAGNFFVCLSIYLQLMAKPLHVKFLMIMLPIFSLVTIGFTHAVADMYLVIIGLINHAPISVGKVVWKIMLPGALGNVIGGSFFGIVIPWYLHLYAVEKDQRRLNLPEYEARDEQPELNSDSRVVRKVPSSIADEYEDMQERYPATSEKGDSSSLGSVNNHSIGPPEQLVSLRSRDLRRLDSIYSRASGLSRFNTASATRYISRSPKNVFPVYGMAPASERERSIASGIDESAKDGISIHTCKTDQNNEDISATYLGDQIKRLFSSMSAGNKRKKDIESQINSPSSSLNKVQSNPIVMKDGISENEYNKKLDSRIEGIRNPALVKQPETFPSNTYTPVYTQPEESSKYYSPAQSINSGDLSIFHPQASLHNSNQSSFNVLDYLPNSRSSKYK